MIRDGKYKVELLTDLNSGNFEPQLDEYIDALTNSAPSILWHYTDSAGLIGILETSKIWATSYRFLNDSSEIQYAMEEFKEELTKKLEKTEGPQLSKILGSIDLTESGLESYISCFTENGDQLSQWRGYGGQNAYAIGFNSRALFQRMKALRVMAGKISYGRDSAHKAAAGWADSVLGTWKNEFPEGYGAHLRENPAFNKEAFDDELVEETAKEFFYFQHQHMGHLLLTAALHKASAFFEEAEWRLIRVDSVASPRIKTKFRSGCYGVTPYKEFQFQEGPHQSIIESIVLGPGFDFQARKGALYSLLDALGYPLNIDVSNSEAPYRG